MSGCQSEGRFQYTSRGSGKRMNCPASCSHSASLSVRQAPVWAHLECLEVHFTPVQEAQLAQIANNSGTDIEHLVKRPPYVCLRITPDSAPLCVKAWRRLTVARFWKKKKWTPVCRR
jgi:hypothetical protein